MSFQYRIFCYEKASSPLLAQELAERLQSFVLPFLGILDAFLDKRLVRTFLELLSTMIEVRHREYGLLRSPVRRGLALSRSHPCWGQTHQSIAAQPEMGSQPNWALSL